MDEDKNLGLPAWLANVIRAGFAICLVWVIVEGWHNRSSMAAGARYTIGQVTETSYSIGPSSHSNARFTYTANGRQYATSSSGDVDEGCTRCLVKFALSDPENVHFFNHVCVPDSIREAPPEGWKEPPFAVPGYVK